MEVTKREVVASISILAIMLIIGFFVGGEINDYQDDLNSKYNKALKIENQELFKYGMETSVGNAFIYGEFNAVDTVSYEDIKDEYIYIEKVREEYTRHIREVVETDSKGNIRTKTEVYYTWDCVSTDSKTCKEITFLKEKFKTNKFDFNNCKYIDTVYCGSDVRYVYNGVPKKFKGTIFAKLKDNNIGNNVKVYANRNIKETKESLTTNYRIIIFWVVWSILIIGVIGGFYYLDNNWLNRN